MPDEPVDLVRYLRDEAPWEVERFESLARVVSAFPESHVARCRPSSSSWLLDAFGQFGGRRGLDGAA